MTEEELVEAMDKYIREWCSSQEDVEYNFIKVCDVFKIFINGVAITVPEDMPADKLGIEIIRQTLGHMEDWLKNGSKIN